MLTIRKTKRSRALRNEPTEAEKRLWYRLRQDQLGIRFRRQLTLNPYIVDFVCPEYKLIIEVDGGQHAEQQEYDTKRTTFLASKGYKVLRFWNNEVLENIEGVIAEILQHLPPLSPLGEGSGERAVEESKDLGRGIDPLPNPLPRRRGLKNNTS